MVIAPAGTIQPQYVTWGDIRRYRLIRRSQGSAVSAILKARYLDAIKQHMNQRLILFDSLLGQGQK